MTRDQEISHLFDRLADTFARLAVLYHPTTTPPPADEPADAPAADGKPKDGRALFLWAKTNGLLPRVESLGRARKYARLAKDWTPDQVADIYSEVTSKPRRRTSAWGGNPS